MNLLFSTEASLFEDIFPNISSLRQFYISSNKIPKVGELHKENKFISVHYPIGSWVWYQHQLGSGKDIKADSITSISV